MVRTYQFLLVPLNKSIWPDRSPASISIVAWQTGMCIQRRHLSIYHLTAAQASWSVFAVHMKKTHGCLDIRSAHIADWDQTWIPRPIPSHRWVHKSFGWVLSCCGIIKITIIHSILVSTWLLNCCVHTVTTDNTEMRFLILKVHVLRPYQLWTIITDCRPYKTDSDPHVMLITDSSIKRWKLFRVLFTAQNTMAVKF